MLLGNKKEERRINRAKNDHLVCHIILKQNNAKGGLLVAIVEDRRNKAKNGKSILLGTNLFRF